jgi:DNA-binding transcriptional ArsR family regulator
MDLHDAVERLSALAHPSRLALFRLLVQRGPEGLAAGVIAETLEVPPPTLSFHLAQLAGAGLVSSRREGRSIVYCADYAASQELVGYLYDNCCGGGCAPLVTLSPAERADRRIPT